MSTPIEELIWELRRLFRELAQAADDALRPMGITAAERALLEFLAKEEGAITLSEIARKRSVSRQHIHQTLGRLNPGWVRRSEDPSDARSIALSLTKEGRNVWRRIRAVDNVLLQRLERGLEARRVRETVKTLQAVRRVLKETKGAIDEP